MISILKKVLPFVLIAILLLMVNVADSQAAPPEWGGGQYHRVRYGETLFSIGRQYGVSPWYIAEVNDLWDPDYIYAGQVLYIPAGQYWGDHPGWGHQPDPCQGNYGYQDCRYPRYRYDDSHYQPYNYGYGYDYTGYYYESNHPNYRRYSYTCGYNYNCY